MQIKKKMIYVGMLALGLSASLLFTQCNSAGSSEQQISQEEQQITNPYAQQAALKVAPAFDNVDVPFHKHQVPVNTGKTITIEETGTIIKIPATAFVDKDGKDITGEVDIEFREFHDAADIIASGIPMQNPETGEYMSTAGMFEIKGSKNGEEIFVKEGKSIEVELASYEGGNEYDFFKMNPKDCSWDKKLDNGTPKINLVRQTEMSNPAPAPAKKPVQPLKYGSTDKFVFDMDVNFQRYPALKTFKDIIWQYNGAANSATNPEKNAWIFEENWSSVKLDRDDKGGFVIQLKNREKEFKIDVLPVLKGKDYEKALAAFEAEMEEYKKIEKAMAERQERLNRQAEFVRSYSIQGFGTFNWDIWKEPNRLRLEVKVDFEEQFDYVERMNDLTLLLVSSNRKAVVRYYPSTLNKFSFPKGDENMLVAILPDNQMAYFSAADFRELESKNLSSGEKVTLKMRTAPTQVASVDDISKVLDMAS